MEIKNDLNKYRKYLEKEVKKFKLSSKDISNLYDCFYMMDDDTYNTFKLNKMNKWFDEFFERVERIVIPELYKFKEEPKFKCSKCKNLKRRKTTSRRIKR